jgi:hypothetical protein
MSHNAVDGKSVSPIVPLSCQVAADAFPDRLHPRRCYNPKQKPRYCWQGLSNKLKRTAQPASFNHTSGICGAGDCVADRISLCMAG